MNENDIEKTKLYKLVVQNATKDLEEALSKGADPNCTRPGPRPSSLLQLAIRLEYLQIVTLLLKAGANVNQLIKNSDRRNCSLLTYAIYRMHFCSDNIAAAKAIAFELIKYNADVTLQDTEGRTALHEAVFTKNVKLCQVLLEKGANINAITSPEEKTPLHFAITNENIEVTEYLLFKGAKINHKNYRGETPLLHAVILYIWTTLNTPGNFRSLRQIEQIIQKLLMYSPDASIQDNQGHTLFTCVIKRIRKNSLKRESLLPALKGEILDRNEPLFKVWLTSSQNILFQSKEGKQLPPEISVMIIKIIMEEQLQKYFPSIPLSQAKAEAIVFLKAYEKVKPQKVKNQANLSTTENERTLIVRL